MRCVELSDGYLAIVPTLIGMGMLGYTLIVSSGYYVERRDVPLVQMFARFWVLTIPADVFRFVGS